MHFTVARNTLFLITIYLSFNLVAVAVPFMKEEPLNNNFIKELLLLAKVPIDDFEESYVSGRKIQHSEESYRFVIRYFPENPRKTSNYVTRLTGYNIVIPEENYKKSNCYSLEIGNCSFITNNYISLIQNAPKQITSETLNNFVLIGNEYSINSDYDDMTLAYLLRIITIPINEIISQNNPEFLIRDYEVKNELGNNQNYYYPIEILKNYTPHMIDFKTNRTNGKREYRVVFSSEEKQSGITVFIERLNIEGTKTKIRVTGGPIP